MNLPLFHILGIYYLAESKQNLVGNMKKGPRIKLKPFSRQLYIFICKLSINVLNSFSGLSCLPTVIHSLSSYRLFIISPIQRSKKRRVGRWNGNFWNLDPIDPSVKSVLESLRKRARGTKKLVAFTWDASRRVAGCICIFSTCVCALSFFGLVRSRKLEKPYSMTFNRAGLD